MKAYSWNFGSLWFVDCLLFPVIKKLQKSLIVFSHKVTSQTNHFPYRTNRCQKVFTNFRYFKNNLISKHALIKFLETNNPEKIADPSDKVCLPEKMKFDTMMAKSIDNLRLDNTFTGIKLGKVIKESGNTAA